LCSRLDLLDAEALVADDRDFLAAFSAVALFFVTERRTADNVARFAVGTHDVTEHVASKVDHVSTSDAFFTSSSPRW
jgi:hypothetical protein